MALRDLWAKLTGKKDEQDKAPPAESPPAATAPATLETRSPPPEPEAPPPPALPEHTPAPPAHTRSEPGLPEDAARTEPLVEPAAKIPPETKAEAQPASPDGAEPPAGDDLSDRKSKASSSPFLPARDVAALGEALTPPAIPHTPLAAPAPVPPPVEPEPPQPVPEPPAPEEPAPKQPEPEPAPLPPAWQPIPQEQPVTPPAVPAAPPPEVPVPPTPRPAELPQELPPPAPQPLAPPVQPDTTPPAPPPVVPPTVRVWASSGEATPAEPVEEVRAGWFGRLRAGLSRSTNRLTEGLTGLFTKRKLDDAALEELEEALITADLGVSAATRIVENFRKSRFGKEVTDEEVKEALAAEIGAILAPVAKPLVLDDSKRPHVVLVAGVNGVGKTTTIAKLGQQWREAGKSVTFVAGDTFRAAAVEQLQIWGARTGCDVVAPAKQGADAAGLAFDALKQAQEKGTDILLVDTAGRLHNKSALMEELRKVVRVMQRIDPTAPHSVLLVLDATTGQNATQQCKVFSEMVNVTGLVVTKLDGSAKGGIVVALAQEFGLPVHAVGVGEKAADLRPFSARDFSRSLLGLD